MSKTFEGNPCRVCGGTERYRSGTHRCLACTKRHGAAKKERRAAEAAANGAAPGDKTYHGEHCSGCGGTERYTSNGSCKPCTNTRAAEFWRNNSEHKYAQTLAWRRANRALVATYARKQRLKREYDLTPDEYATRVAEQAGCCAICRRETKLVIDHCHNGGHVRELLCSACNSGLGQFKDKQALLLAAVAYLEKHKNGPQAPCGEKAA
jgi:hypothetical protein